MGQLAGARPLGAERLFALRLLFLTFADQRGLALRGGHHCNQPLMRKFGLPGTTRASFYFYNTTAEIDRMIDILRDAARFFS